jgi:histidinol-phosphate aminotransferase
MTPFPRPAYRPLDPYAPDRRPVEVDLSDNTNRWGVHPGARAAFEGATSEDLLRYPPVYADRLRAAVARRFQVPEEAVTTGCGSDDLLDSAFRAAGEPGEGVTFVPPTFSMVEIFARMNGMEPRSVGRAQPEEGAPFGPLPLPGELLAGGPALVYVCRPNNPTGEVVPAAWIRALVEEAGPTGPIVLVDEAYADFMREPGSDGDLEPDALVPEAAASSRLVVLRTLSKAYGLAGLRVGFAVGAPEVIREIEKSRGPYKVSRPAEAAAVAAIEDREGWVPGILEAVRIERDRLRSELEARGLRPLPSGGNFLLLPVEGPAAPDGPGEPGDAASLTAALREQGVAVRPFPALPGMGDGVRITIGPRAEMDRFLQALDRVRGRGALP